MVIYGVEYKVDGVKAGRIAVALAPLYGHRGR